MARERPNPGDALIESILVRSRATEGFKRDMLRFAAGEQVSAIEVVGFAPRVKVERVLVQLLNAEPELAIQRVAVRGESGCSDFTGEIRVETATGSHTFGFTWCCRWRAEQEGWSDYFGFPDQIRAAREFGWDCFQRWESRPTTAVDTAAIAHPSSNSSAIA